MKMKIENGRSGQTKNFIYHWSEWQRRMRMVHRRRRRRRHHHHHSQHDV